MTGPAFWKKDMRSSGMFETLPGAPCSAEGPPKPRCEWGRWYGVLRYALALGRGWDIDRTYVGYGCRGMVVGEGWSLVTRQKHSRKFLVVLLEISHKEVAQKSVNKGEIQEGDYKVM
jgi:hypothetical protein